MIIENIINYSIDNFWFRSMMFISSKVINNTIVVCVVVLISALVVLLLDFVFGLGMDLLLTAGA